MSKIQRNYRLSGETLEQIEHLAYGLHISDASVVALAVAELFAKKVSETGTRLIPRENGQYDVQFGGVTKMTIEADYLKGIPQHEIEAMLRNGSLKTQEGHMWLQSVKAGKGLTIYVEQKNSDEGKEETEG